MTAAIHDLSAWPLSARVGLAGLLTDVDDTLTDGGVLLPSTRAALQALQAAGVPVVAVTGRPVGWSEPLVVGDPAQGGVPWPLRAVLAENGAVCLQRIWVSNQNGLQRPSDGRWKLSKTYQTPGAERARHFAHLQRVLAHIEAVVPGARRAEDSAGRETDIAVDHSEHHPLGPDQIAQVLNLMRAEGLTATVSSIHINGWMGQHNKWQGACWFLRELMGVDLAQDRKAWAYVGDSSNDQAMFAEMPHSVGVANIDRFLPLLSHPPRYRTPSPRGAGFVEVASAILAARGLDAVVNPVG